MTAKQKLIVRYALAAVGITALAVAARHADVDAVGGALRDMDPLFGIAAMVTMIVLKLGAKVVRSQLLLVAECGQSQCKAPSWLVTARLHAASHAAGQLAWGPLGFTVRTVALKEGGMPLGAIARVHVAERIAEATGIAVFAVLALVFEPTAVLGSWVGRLLVGGFALLLVGGAVVAFVPVLRGKLARRAIGGRLLAISAAWAFASSAADVAVLCFATHAMHVEVGIAPLLLAFLAVNGACALPITPAQLGVQEVAITIAFATAGIPAPLAVACALAYRVAHLVPLALVGVPSLVVTWLPRRRAALADTVGAA